MSIRIDKILSILLFIACCFPYIQIIDLPSDTQPYALIIGVVLVLFFIYISKDFRIPYLLLPFIFVSCYSIILFMMTTEFEMAFRSLVGYISITLISLASFKSFKYIKGKYFIYIVLVWLFFGATQLLISKEFGSLILARLSTSDSRGVTSLATEPSFYAIMCIFFFLINDILFAQKEYSKKIYISIFIILITQMLFSRAGVGMVLLFIYLGAKVIANTDVKKMFSGIIVFLSMCLVFIGIFTISPILKESRVGHLLDKALTNPVGLFYTDGSIVDRTVHILISHLSLFYNYGLGFGLGNWDSYAYELATKIGGFPLELANINMTVSGRIMSAWGTAIFELGIVGLVVFLAFALIMYKGFKSSGKNMKPVYITSFITVYVIMVMAIPLALPIFGYLIGVFVYIQSVELNKKANTSIIKNHGSISERYTK